MSQDEAIKKLASCKAIYSKIRELPGFHLNEEGLDCLKELVHVYEAGLLEDDRVLQAADLKLGEAASLVGLMVIYQIIK